MDSIHHNNNLSQTKRTFFTTTTVKEVICKGFEKPTPKKSYEKTTTKLSTQLIPLCLRSQHSEL